VRRNETWSMPSRGGCEHPRRVVALSPWDDRPVRTRTLDSRLAVAVGPLGLQVCFSAYSLTIMPSAPAGDAASPQEGAAVESAGTFPAQVSAASEAGPARPTPARAACLAARRRANGVLADGGVGRPTVGRRGSWPSQLWERAVRVFAHTPLRLRG
ncbi:unnamed protein product, partial [Prorocentrum cordatum]